MALETNSVATYSRKGLREDLTDVIYDISPTDTPVLNAIGRSKAKAVSHEWQTDALAAATTANAQLEGDANITSFDSRAATVRVGNYCQISRKLISVSGTAETVDKAGRNSEMAYQTAKAAKELKRDMETIILANIGGDAGGPTTARQTATFGAWLKTNISYDTVTTPGVNPTYTSGVPSAARTDGTARAFDEGILKDVIELMWASGADLKYLFVGSVNKQKVSAFTGIATRNFDMSRPQKAAIIAAADVYVSDFGVLKVVPNRFMRERDAYFIDPDYAGIGYLRPFMRKKLADTGDSDRRMLLVEWCLVVKNEAAHGLAADLTTTA